MTGVERVRWRLRVAYDGAEFSGWQVQPGQRTVQGVLSEAAESVFGEAVAFQGAGRTDAGVHALGQVCHFDAPRALPPGRLLGALAAALPDDIRPVALETAPAGFHALHTAHRKTYFYQLHLSSAVGGLRVVERSVPPHRRRTFHAVRAGLDLVAMRRAAAELVGTHDFRALSKAMPAGRGTVKTVHAVRLMRVPGGLRVFVTGGGFLYGMVRLMAGLLVEVGRGRFAAGDVGALLEAGDRARAPASLPARGLFLWRVDYAD